jgi:transposase
MAAFEVITEGSVAAELDIGRTVVRRWVQQAEESGPAATLSPDERSELQRLRKENQELRMEKEILRKARFMDS